MSKLNWALLKHCLWLNLHCLLLNPHRNLRFRGFTFAPRNQAIQRYDWIPDLTPCEMRAETDGGAVDHRLTSWQSTIIYQYQPKVNSQLDNQLSLLPVINWIINYHCQPSKVCLIQCSFTGDNNHLCGFLPIKNGDFLNFQVLFAGWQTNKWIQMGNFDQRWRCQELPATTRNRPTPCCGVRSLGDGLEMSKNETTTVDG